LADNCTVGYKVVNHDLVTYSYQLVGSLTERGNIVVV